MRKRWRWLVGAALLIAIVGVLVWTYAQDAAIRRWVPGEYTSPKFDGEGTVKLGLSADGSALWEVYPPGTSKPTA
ncbi:MAG TPA: hypothetical protein VHR66_17200 [Gemmataceae bacterium]|jgi:lipopolysaccharide export system protein LptC|nr:hypothetical protein [Gemmataceae bacterium]